MVYKIHLSWFKSYCQSQIDYHCNWSSIPLLHVTLFACISYYHVCGPWTFLKLSRSLKPIHTHLICTIALYSVIGIFLSQLSLISMAPLTLSILLHYLSHLVTLKLPLIFINIIFLFFSHRTLHFFSLFRSTNARCISINPP